jgi:aminopeptidase
VSDSRLARLADVLVGYSAGVKPGELVLLETPVIVEPLMEELYRAVLEAGGQPVTRIDLDLAEVLYREGNDDQIAWVNPAP